MSELEKREKPKLASHERLIICPKCKNETLLVIKILQIIFIVISMLLFLGSHFLYVIFCHVSNEGIFFGVVISISLLIDTLILIGFVLLISVIISLLVELI